MGGREDRGEEKRRGEGATRGVDGEGEGGRWGTEGWGGRNEIRARIHRCRVPLHYQAPTLMENQKRASALLGVKT